VKVLQRVKNLYGYKSRESVAEFVERGHRGEICTQAEKR
jgi:hypothetical protein